MNQTKTKLGPLDCIVIDDLPEGQNPEKLAVVCHGFGASGDDLAGFGPALLEVQQIARSFRFIFPEAPLDLTSAGMPGGRAWWEINMARLAEMHQTQDFEQLAKTEPQGMAEATGKLAECIKAAHETCGLCEAETVVSGFSQGAMISTDLVLRNGFQPLAMALFSGTIVCEEAWVDAVETAKGCPVLQSHGHGDMVLPYSQAEALQQMLSKGRFEVQFESFPGGHTIPMEVLTGFAKMLIELG